VGVFCALGIDPTLKVDAAAPHPAVGGRRF